MMKRPSVDSAAEEPVAKRPATVPDGPLGAVIEALDDSTGQGVLLSKMAEHSLGCFKDKRHAWQAEVVEWIGKAFSAKAELLQSEVDATKSKVSNFEAARSGRKEALEEAKVAFGQLTATSAEAETALKEAIAASSAAASERASKKADVKNHEKQLAAPIKRKAFLDEAKSAVEQITTTTFSTKECQRFGNVGKQLGLEASMLKSLVLTLSKDPSERSEFDKVIVTNFLDAYSQAVDATQATIDEHKTAVDEILASLPELEKKLADASAQKAACRNAASDARKALDSAECEVDAATVKVKRFFHDFKADADAYDEAVAALRAFSDGALATFNEMKDKTSPPAVEAVQDPGVAEQTTASAEVPVESRKENEEEDKE
jgi:hypothetical protein